MKKNNDIGVYQGSILQIECVVFSVDYFLLFDPHISICFQKSVVDRDALSRSPSSSSSCVAIDDRTRIGVSARGRRQMALVTRPAIGGERRHAPPATSGAASVPSPPVCGPTVQPVRRLDSPNRSQEFTPSKRAVRTAVTATVRAVGVR